MSPGFRTRETKPHLLQELTESILIRKKEQAMLQSTFKDDIIEMKCREILYTTSNEIELLLKTQKNH